MKKILLRAFVLGILAVLAVPVLVQARVHRIGDMGFHGGISEMRHLPRTLETILLQNANNNRNTRNNRNNAVQMAYSEYVFIGGRPVLFEGIKELRTPFLNPGTAAPSDDSGTFRVEHRVFPGVATGDASISRQMIYDVQFAMHGTQTVYSMIVDNLNWFEEIETPAGTFVLDPTRSHFNVSIWEDRTPAISFYRGDISARSVYTGPNGTTIVEKTGEIIGFSTAWSAVETVVLNVSIVNDEWAMQYQIRPSVTVNKDLQFVQNTPFVISFEGNYRELHQSFAGLRYDIFVMPHFMWDEPLSGSHSMETFNVFEQLPAPDLSFMRGHPAEDDIHRLFAMQILQGNPQFFVPNQAITRGQFLTALARAIKLPVEEVVLPRAVRGQPPVPLMLFSDVTTDRPEFRYIQAIQRAGIAFGRTDGKFYFDYPISRQEAIAVIIRALGLSNLAVDPAVVSPFVDSDELSDWAVRHVNVALLLGLIAPDADGYLHPHRAISNAEAAAMLNRLLEYMRWGIVSHYSEQIVNIVQ